MTAHEASPKRRIGRDGLSPVTAPFPRPPVDLWRAPWERIAGITTVSPKGLEPDLWEFPEQYFVAHAPPSHRRIDFGLLRAGALAAGLLDDEAEGVVRRLKRIVMLLATHDAVRSRRTLMKPLSYASLAGMGRRLAADVRVRLTDGPKPWRRDACPDGCALFADLDAAWWVKAGDRHVEQVLNRLAGLAPTDAFTDRPRDYRGVGAVQAGKPELRNETLPIEDDRFEAILRAAMEFSALSADAIALRALDNEPMGPMTRRGAADERRARVRAFRGTVLHPDHRFTWSPGPMATGNAGGKKWPSVWRMGDAPSLGHAWQRLAILAQAANAVLLAFATGMRPEEVNVLPRDCLERVNRDLAVVNGFRLKDSDAVKGEPRDWPLPEIAVEVIRRQQALAAAIDPAGRGLWVFVVGACHATWKTGPLTP